MRKLVIVGAVLAIAGCGLPEEDALYTLDQSLVQLAPSADAQVRSGSYTNTGYGAKSARWTRPRAVR